MRLRRYPFRAMGSPCELQLWDDGRGDSAAEAARAEVERLERKYSRYRDESLASRINASAGSPEGVEVDPETASLLDYAETAFRESGGLFDLTSGVLRRAWDFKAKRVPSQAEIDALRARVGWRKLRWERPRLVLPLAGMELDFGGYVKEYAADRAAAVCLEHGVRHGFVDLGGDLHLIGPHPDGRPWRVGIRDPFRPGTALFTLEIARGGVASSGDTERCMLVGGRRYGHILNPNTGWPVAGFAAVSVVASHALVAGTGATVAMLKGVADGGAWLDALGLPNLRITHERGVSGTLVPRRPAA